MTDPDAIAQENLANLARVMQYRLVACTLCNGIITNSDYLRHYDKSIGIVRICPDCVLKAIAYYVDYVNDPKNKAIE